VLLDITRSLIVYKIFVDEIQPFDDFPIVWNIVC
jgi:hypothetical protein